MKLNILPTKLLSFILYLVVVSCMAPLARAVDVNWTGPNNGNWTAAANWTTQNGNNLVPDQGFDEAAAISNNTTAVVSSSTIDVGGIKLGVTAGSSGGLRVSSGGSLTSRVPDLGGVENGAIQVGIAGQGMVTVVGGGTLSGASITSGGAAGSSITLGDATSSMATLNISGNATLGRTTTITGPNVNFNVMGNLSLGSTGTLVADIRNSMNHSAIKTEGTASVNGVFKPMFTGVTPVAGNKWTLIDAATAINGTFSSIDTSMVPTIPGAAYQVISATSGTRKLLQLSVEEVLVLQVNRDSGAVTISNPGAMAKTFDGYSILSPHGSLTGTWNSLQDQAVPGFVEAGPTANALSELNPGQTPPGTLTMNSGQTRSLGTPYAKTFPAFGVDPDDIVFEYSNPDGQTRQGQIAYSGTKVHNNLILTVDPATGQAAFKNDSPFTVNIDGYSVYSDSGSLQTSWSSLDDQNITGWEEASPTANALAELKADGALTLQPGTGFNLGALFRTTGSTQDLRLEFLQTGMEGPSIGAVVYGAFTVPPQPGVGVTGDFNNNGTVDAADYVLWRNGGPLQNDPTAGVQPEDYNAWRANFGRTAGGGAALAAASVPEPTSMALLWVVAASAMCCRQRKPI